MTQDLNIQALQAKLTLGLKDIYQIALEADEQLERLESDEKGNFAAIFQTDSGFTVNANRFLPYLIELNDEIQSLAIMAPENQIPKVHVILKKIKLMHETLNRFHSIRDEETVH